jgi:hypothetical protein
MTENWSPDSQFTYDDVRNMISVLDRLIAVTGELLNKYDNKPAPNSRALQEWETFPNEILAKDVHYRGIQSMDAAADHLMVFIDSISEPAKTVAPWTCVRGLMESCALSIWFLDPTIDAKVRVARCFAFRYSGLIQQIKFLQSDQSLVDIEKTRRRIATVEQSAVVIGYPRLLDKNGEINGIAMYMPTIVDLIRITLDQEAGYRLLSAVAHGHHWATAKIGYRVAEIENSKDKDIGAFEKYLYPESALYLGKLAITSFAKVLWDLWRQFGWNLDEMRNILEQTRDQLNNKPELHLEQ